MKSTLSRLFSVFLLLALLLAGVGIRPAYAAGYTVNTLNDDTNNDGLCTLREAILAANNAPANNNCGSASSGNDTITFNVSGTTITLTSTLPNIVSGQGTLTIDGGGNITISGNNSVRVMYVNSGANLTLQNLTIANGNGGDFGGGIRNDGTLAIISSTIANNRAGDFIAGVGGGGGIFNSGTLTVTNSTLSDNLGYLGGGIYNGGTLTVTNSTFSGNSAISGGGIRNVGTATLQNTIIANSTSGGDCVNSGGSVTGNNNLIEDSANACGLTDGSNGNIIGSDPNLGALTGSPAYFPLNTGSPAIDKGDNATCAAAPVSNQSQNGVTRPKDGNDDGAAVCDIGSYEALAPTALIVSAHSLQASYSGSGPASFTVTFNKDADNPPGNSGADDVTNPANYLLIEKGANSAADTASCAGGLAGDDTQKTVTAVSYNNATRTSTVTLAGALPPGSYRLFVCGTTSIVTASDNTPLNNGASDFTFDFVVQRQAALPATGFPIGRVTSLPAQPLEKAYASYADLRLQIPSLGVDAPIVGVLKTDGSWDVSWLGTSVGWLEGSAFPTWSGNTVLTGHVWNADNTPGIFAGIKNLKYGDRFTIRAYGQTYVYEVRENTWLWGASRVDKVFKHEEKDWVTLLTCEGYNPLSGNYLFRRMVRAVLIEVK
jgi:LPXTG-site transpeptidase (sortase) family protein